MYFSRTWIINQEQGKLVYAVIILFLIVSSVFCEVEVKITKGILKGQILKSRNERPYYSFTGIPYAKPPVGKLRFEAPEPIDPWDGTLDATKHSNACVQKHETNSSEDCLYLNVYTPSIDADFPVMFWIHGGAFYLGHSSPNMFGPDYFMDTNVVLVSINFRLGILGFLSTEDDVIPGNYGMKDQVLALQWVQENIDKFGGDPGKVTIFGGSSGGASTGYHMLSPMSKGLFHKAILQSGTPLCRWSTYLPGVARDRSKIISRLAGCDGNSSSTNMLKCLKALPERFFSDVYEKLWEWRSYPTVLFSPVVEQCNSGREAFLCRHQLNEFKQESFVPAIIGLNSAEGGMIVSSLYNDTSIQYPELYTGFNRLLSIILSHQHFTLDLDEIGENVFKKYFPSGKIGDHSHFKTIEMITDGRYLHGILDMAFKLVSPVYFYLYDYQNEFSFNTLYGKCNKKLGITHGDELTSLFKSDTINPRKLNLRDTAVSKLMVDVWTKFATAKLPTIDGTINGPAWPTFHSQRQSILHIHSDHPDIIQNPFEEKYIFWNKLPLLSNFKKVISKNKFSSYHMKNELFCHFYYQLIITMKTCGILMLLVGLVFGTDNTLKLSQGKIKGSVFKSRNGRDFQAFQGIPYAKPPIGDLRLQDPVEANSWKGILDATKEKPMCIQKNLFMYQSYNTLLGAEDCLYINVYTPKVHKKKNDLLPVMVWIPGGGFSSGHGGMSLYGPQYLLDKDVVVASFNYRVGPLGFLSTEDDILPGNYGMKDQVLALKWVKNNIEKFGGDPNKVTIFGESAGSVSVGLHLLSPLSKGLFHKAILESGTPLCRWGVSPPGWAKRRASALSTISGCPEDSKQLAECLRDMPAELLVDLLYNLFEWKVFPAITFMPVVENCENKTGFLCKYPLVDFKQETNVPILMGMNSGEGGLFAARIYNEKCEVDLELKNNFNHYISSLLIYKYTAKVSDLPIISKKIYKRYFVKGNMDDPLNSVKMISGGIFLDGIFDMAIKLSSPVHYYVYNHTNEMSFNSFFGPCPKKLGVTHGDEMISLFFTKDQAELKGEDLNVSKLMIDIWTSFAITDKPTIDGTDNGKKWPLLDSESMQYLLISSSKPIISTKPFIEEYTFWKSLPLSSQFKKTEEVLKTEL
ncbi:uncharacterized protein LOC132925065 [Rhopalosiphum padi]|uniref:uncharacterized protein LOC132925065 n=1 Tax=Rhopalosiphum padi TaxID=40932 RepID=UPI00298E6486|nr:uncharacterized protein LOC132925065 [Rhopalosiphum padi]